MNYEDHDGIYQDRHGDVIEIRGDNYVWHIALSFEICPLTHCDDGANYNFTDHPEHGITGELTKVDD